LASYSVTFEGIFPGVEGWSTQGFSFQFCDGAEVAIIHKMI
jgi:hypothetical protein